MKVRIEIECDGAAFDPEAGGHTGAELARILRDVARKADDCMCASPDALRSQLERDWLAWRGYDENGNRCLTVSVAPEVAPR